jgi:hypothetical protein
MHWRRYNRLVETAAAAVGIVQLWGLGRPSKSPRGTPPWNMFKWRLDDLWLGMQTQNIAVADRIIRHFEHEALEECWPTRHSCNSMIRPVDGGLSTMTTLRDVDDDFAEVRARSHVLVGRVHLVEAEHFVDHWFDPVRRNGPVHRLEHLHRADRNALHVGAASENQSRVEFGRRPAQAADQANLAAEPDRAERARQGMSASLQPPPLRQSRRGRALLAGRPQGGAGAARAVPK